MRILHVLRDLELGGAQVVTQTLVTGLRDRGHDVAVAAMPGALSPAVPGRHYPMPLTGIDPRLMRPAVRALERVISDFRPDVIHAHNPGLLLVAGLTTRRGRRVPSVATLHGSAPSRYPFDAMAARVAGIPVIACGPAVADAMRRAGRPVDATILNGTDPRPRLEAAQVRQSLGVTDEDVLFPQAARLSAPKDPLLVLDAFAQVAHPTWKLAGSSTLSVVGP